MIEIKRDKELIRIESIDEVRSRPGFNPNLDPQKHELATIIGRYVEPEKVICGLSSCHQPHTRGYIVTTKDGQETNIGKDCGKTHFGVDFVDLSRQFDRDITEKENRDRLWSFSFQLDKLKERIHELRSGAHGADWIHNNTRYLVMPNKGLPEVVSVIGNMIRMRQNTLQVDRQASEEEAARIEVAQGRKLPRPHYIREDIADIEGLEAMYPENDVRELLVKNLESRIKDFEKQNVDILGYTALISWVKWTQTVEQTLDQATEAVDYGRRLLNPINLTPFEKVIRDKQEVQIFRKFLKALS
ncbi:MAG TPA: hypothetical protein VF811_09235 [Parasulfuritortus sp.]